MFISSEVFLAMYRFWQHILRVITLDTRIQWRATYGYFRLHWNRHKYRWHDENNKRMFYFDALKWTLSKARLQNFHFENLLINLTTRDTMTCFSRQLYWTSIYRILWTDLLLKSSVLITHHVHWRNSWIC